MRVTKLDTFNTNDELMDGCGYEGNYKNDKKEGLWTWWYENGQKRLEGNFMDGKLNKQHRNNQLNFNYRRFKGVGDNKKPVTPTQPNV